LFQQGKTTVTVDCIERDKLIETWNSSLTMLSSSVTELNASTDGDFKQRHRDTVLARLNAQNAVKVLALHRSQHDC
jgi:hypothetical protein